MICFNFRKLLFYSWVSFVTIIILPGVASAAPSPYHLNQSSEPSQALQRISSGHALSFRETGVYIAAGSHMVRGKFAGTNGAIPQTGTYASSGIAPLEKIIYSNLWEGISLTYDNPPGAILRSTYRLKPWANPDQIALHYNVPFYLDASGNLTLSLTTGAMTASAPVAWQEIDGKQVAINVSFRISTTQSTVHFSLGHYNPAYPLFIDPTLTWNTFMGSPLEDEGRTIAVDDSGNVYIAGSSETTWGSPVNAHSGFNNNDAFVAKLSSSGETVWNTFLGGWSSDEARAVAVDDNGNVYVAGDSYSAWGSSPVHPYTDDRDVFVAKLDSNGELDWNTFLGSSSRDEGEAIAIDENGFIYVAGWSEATWGQPKDAFGGGLYDGFAAKLYSTGETDWTTFMGGTESDYSKAITVDSSGNVYVGGFSHAAWGSSPVNAYAGSDDAFVVKLDDDGNRQWHTFLGGSSADQGYGIAIDSEKNVYITGLSYNSWGNPINDHVGGSDVFAAKLDSDGETEWNTFMGSSGYDHGTAIALDNNGNIYIVGDSPATWGSPANAHAGAIDAFTAKLSNNGTRRWNTFMGSAETDYAYAIAVNRNRNIYVTGDSTAEWGSPLNAHTTGSDDVFAAKLQDTGVAPGIQLLLLGL